jgi:hypothetical protein
MRSRSGWLDGCSVWRGRRDEADGADDEEDAGPAVEGEVLVSQKRLRSDDNAAVGGGGTRR